MRFLLTCSALAVATAAACVPFEDESAGAEDVVEDTATPDTGGETDTSTGEDAGMDVTEDAGELEPWSAPGACGDDTVFAYPVQFQGCDFTFDPPDWQRTQRDLQVSCGEATGDGAPQSVHLTYPSNDAAHSVGVLWMTDYETRAGDVQYGTDPENLDRWQRGITFSYDLVDGERRVHEAHLCGLQANTTYYYRAGTEGAWSEVFTFTTAPEFGNDDAFTFAVTGDTRSPTQEMWGQALDDIEERGAQFLVFTGDAVDVGTIQAQWDVWWTQGTATADTDRLSSMPIMYAHGNHDFVGDPMWAMMAYPGDEQNYYVRFGNALFIMLDDSGLIWTGQTVEEDIRNFLREALDAHPDVTWRFVAHHKPIYSASTNHGSTRQLQDAWMPLYEEFGVDMVFNGHDHNYERSCPVREERCVADGDGTVYLVAAGIGAPLYNNGEDWWTVTSRKEPTYVIVDIDGNELSMTTFDLFGTEVDTYSLTKD